MTRENIRFYNSPATSDADTHAALWAATPFARLPEDAPPELRRLTVELDEPKRVYAIQKASRRHHFQILVDRYIHQIRSGCTSAACNTPTCFSCRKKAAGGMPIRRYNSTSARTLAMHMLSLDNPEQGLCNYPPAPRPSDAIISSKPSSKRPPTSELKFPGHGEIKIKPNRAVQTSHRRNNNTQTASSNQAEAKNTEIGPSNFEDSSANDHRSFVQHMFETIAFKMVEWLTPRNLEYLANLESTDHSIKEDPSLKIGNSNSEEYQNETDPLLGARAPYTKADISPDGNPTGSIEAQCIENTIAEVTNKPAIPLVEKAPQLQTDSLSRHLSSQNMRKKTESPDSQGLKGILNKVPKSDAKTDKFVSPRRRSGNVSKSRPSRQALIRSPKMQVSGLEPLITESAIPATKPQVGRTENQHVDNQDISAKKLTLNETQELVTGPSTCDGFLNLPSAKLTSFPQSLSCLTIETIDLLCNILQTDGTHEKHFLHPRLISNVLKRQRNSPNPQLILQRNPLLQNIFFYPNPGRQRWKAFIEQSFFDVLGKPESLLRTFSDENKGLFDTQTIWYLMFRMTRVAPSLVFDSLWRVLGKLFRPPKKLEAAYDWAKEFPDHRSISRKAVSNHDAAQIINICLHALVAAAPLVDDARQLANMSRIRSYGLSMLGRETSPLEPITLCLQYEDAFTNELAVRLARRLFSSINTRRRFTELLELQIDVHHDGKREPDILDTILSTLKFLDSDTIPVLKFSDSERDLHEKRVPTLILDWARTVMMQDWQGAAEVPIDGPFGGALATIAAIYKNRKSLLLGDIHFRTEYFSERLDPISVPNEWLSFNSNKKTTHLLDHPYLFNPATLVTYFRAINYSRMNLAYEEAKAKHNLMGSTMQEACLMTDKYSRDRLKERLRTATTRFLVLEISRDNVLIDTFNSIWRREERELMRPLKLRLGEEGGEEGMDSGGVQQEYLRLAIAEALNPDYGTFSIDSRTKMTWFQPGSPEPLWKFELIGMIFSLAVYNGLTLPVTFPKALYRKLLDEEVTELHHISDGWPDLANGLTTLLEWDEKDGLIEDVFARTYEFSVEQFGRPVTLEMKSGSSIWPQFSSLDNHSSSNVTEASLVTNENRNSYVSDYIRYLTDISIRPQFTAFKSGFFTCISRRSISFFDAPTLQSLIEGIQEIDIAELRRATRYIGWEGDANHSTIQDFWGVVKKYDQEMKKKLLEFVTASDRVPVGGMRGMQFTIQKNGIGDTMLPTTYTCFGILLLPEYSEKEILKARLAMALENSRGFGFA